MDFSMACCLEDNQDFYYIAMQAHAVERANRFVAILHLLSEEDPVAALLLRGFSYPDAISNFLMNFREIDALIYSLESNFVRNLSVAKELQILVFALFPVLGINQLSDLNFIFSFEEGSVVRCPLLSSTVVLTKRMSALELAEMLGAKKFSKGLNPVPDAFTNWGIRVSVAASQPSVQGEEFHIIQDGFLPGFEHRQRILDVLNGMVFIDHWLAVSMANLMSLYTVVPRKPELRQAGSVSSVPGWAWQDIDAGAEYDLEYGHLSVQMVHEFFHTKLYLIEKNIPLYVGGGNNVTLFSPWKQRARPLRQVLHALFTFSAGAAVWMKLLDVESLDRRVLLPIAEEYCKENMGFAFQAQEDLYKLGSLTPEGKEFVEQCVFNLKQVVSPLF